MSWVTPGALTCFGLAARECGAASINVGADTGADTGGTGHVFVIEPGGAPCQVTGASAKNPVNLTSRRA